MEGEKPNLKNDPYIGWDSWLFPPLLSLCPEQGQLQRAAVHSGQGASSRERNSVFLARGPGKAALALTAAPIGRNCRREVAETPKAKRNKTTKCKTKQDNIQARGIGKGALEVWEYGASCHMKGTEEGSNSAFELTQVPAQLCVWDRPKASSHRLWKLSLPWNSTHGS